METKDLFIIGGGINGAAIACDAAGRGLSVVVCEKNDLASATSSASTKLIHGGLRYLELYEFQLVRNALREQSILMQKAPHLISPLEFILPHEKHLRPVWLIRLGLFLYDHLLCKKNLPSSKRVNLKKTVYGDALKNTFKDGFSYYDCFTDDARLTLLNAIAAREKGAEILSRHEFISARPLKNQWKVTYKNTLTDETKTCFANMLVNASGPWINLVQQKINPEKSIPHELVKGSHIIVPALFSGDFAYILQNEDQRIVFAIPYQRDFTLIGTTDVAFVGDVDKHIKISPDEENYLCKLINRYFKTTITPRDIIASYAGVRCLQQDMTEKLSAISRDYQLQLDTDSHPPLLTIIGGKITTHRSLAEEAVNLMGSFFTTLGPTWTKSAPLPGGDFPQHNLQIFKKKFQRTFSWLPEEIQNRYIKNYGTRAYIILNNAKNIQDLGEDFSHGLYEKELVYLIQQEWAMTVEDILWRRTKLGLVFSEEEKNKMAEWLEKYLGPPS